MLTPSDHDLLIRISVGQEDMRADVRLLADTMRDMKTAIDTTNARQADLESRMTSISSTVQRSLGDQHDDHKHIVEVSADFTRWKTYLRAGIVIFTPAYLIFIAVAVEAAKKFFGF